MHSSTRYVAAETNHGALRSAYQDGIRSVQPQGAAAVAKLAADLGTGPSGAPLRVFRVAVDEVRPPPVDERAPEPRAARVWWRIIIGIVPFAILTGVNVLAIEAEHHTGRAWDWLAEWMGVDP